jgi:hypothetical protein
MITEAMVLNKIRREIGDDIQKVMPPSWFINIVEDETLITWSIYYPKIIRGVIITVKNGIRTKHPQSGLEVMYKYKIPKDDPSHEYINIEQFFYPGNNVYNQASSTLPMMNAVQQMVLKAMPSAQFFNTVRFSVRFEPPDICYVDPIPFSHVDFSLNMQRKCKLWEVPLYYRELFLNLCICDIKLALYNKFKNLRDGQTFQGVEIQTSISDFNDAKSERKELLDLFRKDFFKNPDRFSADMFFSS